MAGLTAAIGALALACAHPTPPKPANAPEAVPAAFNPETLPLNRVPALLVVELTHQDYRVLALRAHAAVLALERDATPNDTRPESLLERFRLHALAAELGEYAFEAKLGFYGNVDGVTVDLHDLRNAQLLTAAPGLLALDTGPAVERRIEHIRYHLPAVKDNPAFADTTLVLGLLSAPVE